MRGVDSLELRAFWRDGDGNLDGRCCGKTSTLAFAIVHEWMVSNIHKMDSGSSLNGSLVNIYSNVKSSIHPQGLLQRRLATPVYIIQYTNPSESSS